VAVVFGFEQADHGESGVGEAAEGVCRSPIPDGPWPYR
jgi:hypothetical protein